MLSIVLCFLLCFVINLWWKKKYDSGGPPQHPGALPLLGNAHQFLGSNIKVWEYMQELSYFSLKSGGVSVVYLGPLHRIYIVTDPDDYLTISNACLDKPFFYDIVKEWTSKGLISADVSTWKPDRKLLNPMFSQQRMNEYLEIFNSQARRLVDRMSDQLGKGKFDSRKYFIVYAQESICQIMLGLEGEHFANKIKDYGEAVEDLLEVFIAKSQKLWLHIPFIYERSSYKKKLDRSIKVTSEIINKLIQNKRDDLKKSKHELNKSTTAPVFEMMLHLQETQGSFTDNDIKEHLETLIFTGFDSVTESLTFAMKLIGSNQRVQQRLYEELQEVLGDTSVDVNRYDLTQLVYLDAVTKETLRMSNTVPVVARKILKDVKLKNYTLRAGSNAALSGFGIHRHSIWGSDVEDFRPERWLEPSLAANNNPNLFAAFSLGKRNCIGKLFAIYSFKTILVHLIRRYRILTDDTKSTTQYAVAIRSVTGHEISLERR